MLPRPPWNDTDCFISGIHPHLLQRRRDAYALPSPVTAGATCCRIPATRSPLGLRGATHGFRRYPIHPVIRLTLAGGTFDADGERPYGSLTTL